MTQEQVIQLIIGSEKGLNENEPASAGGVSLDGITQTTFDAYLKRLREQFPDLTESVRDIEGRADREAVVDAFYVLYLGDFHTWDLPEFLQYIYADFATNAGHAAAKIVQQIIGVPADGVIGSGTQAALETFKADVATQQQTDPSVDHDLIMQFHEAKLDHYQHLADENPDEYAKWMPGWKKRALHVISELQEYFVSDAPTPSALHPSDVPKSKEPTYPESHEMLIPLADVEEGSQPQPSNWQTLNDRLSRLENLIAGVGERLQAIESRLPEA